MKHCFDVAVIGGMGPLASAELYRRTVLYTNSKKDADHLRLCLLSNPRIPDRSDFIIAKEGKERTPSPLNAIKQQIKAAKRLHCRYFAVACNTAHYFYEDFLRIRGITFINTVKETVEYAAYAYPEKTLCVLATLGTVKADVYRTHAPKGSKLHYPSNDTNEKIMRLIKDIKSGKKAFQCNPKALISDLKEEFDTEKTVFILGCTELSLVKDAFRDLTAVDSTDVLAGRIISVCKKRFNTERFKLKASFFEK